MQLGKPSSYSQEMGVGSRSDKWDGRPRSAANNDLGIVDERVTALKP